MCLMIDRLILSRLESLSALLQVFQIFRGRSKARLCDLLRSAVAPLHKSHRLAKARIKAVAFVFLSVGLCQSRKDPYLPLEPQCVRLLPRPMGLPPMAFAVSFRIRLADAKTAVKHHRPTHIRPLGPHHKCTLISRPTAVPAAYIFVAK